MSRPEQLPTGLSRRTGQRNLRFELGGQTVQPPALKAGTNPPGQTRIGSSFGRQSNPAFENTNRRSKTIEERGLDHEPPDGRNP